VVWLPTSQLEALQQQQQQQQLIGSVVPATGCLLTTRLGALKYNMNSQQAGSRTACMTIGHDLPLTGTARTHVRIIHGFALKVPTNMFSNSHRLLFAPLSPVSILEIQHRHPLWRHSYLLPPMTRGFCTATCCCRALPTPS
jgi:hypothetical protein